MSHGRRPSQPRRAVQGVPLGDPEVTAHFARLEAARVAVNANAYAGAFGEASGNRSDARRFMIDDAGLQQGDGPKSRTSVEWPAPVSRLRGLG